MPLLTLTIKARLALVIITLTSLLIVVGGLGLSGMAASNAANQETNQAKMPAMIALGNTEHFLNQQRTTLDQAALILDPGAAQMVTLLAQEADLSKQALAAWNTYLALPRNAGQDAVVKTMTGELAAIGAALETFRNAIKEADRDRVLTTLPKVDAAYAALQTHNAEMKKVLGQQAATDFKTTEAKYGVFQLVSLGAILAGLAAALYSWFSLRSRILLPIQAIMGHFDAIAAGDLRQAVTIDDKDEMGLLLAGLAKMQLSLVETVTAVRSGSDAIATASQEIAAGNLDLSSRTEEQASALEQTASAMDQFMGAAHQNADNARQANQLAASASDIASKGGAVVSQVVGTMSSINESSKKIVDIISVIDGIAFQTNILALNAAVEAARAGEQGRGFAVVASEVRNLAQRSAGAAREIKELISASVDTVNAGTRLVDQAGQTMQEIVASVKRVTDIMTEISSASDEQTRGISQISGAIGQMDAVTQQNAALVEEAAAATESLRLQADTLTGVVSVFRLAGTAAAAPARASGRAAPRLA